MRPDLLLVDKSYSTYVVVEVELITDNISHVKQQTEVFSSAEYSEEMVDYLCRNNQQIDSDRLVDLFKYQRPQVLVLLNEHGVSERWGRVCVDENIHLGAFEVFSAASRESIYFYSGYIPNEIKEININGRKSRMMNNLVVNSPNLIDCDDESKIRVIDNGTLITLKKQGEILFPITSCSIYNMPANSEFTLSKGSNAEFLELIWE